MAGEDRKTNPPSTPVAATKTSNSPPATPPNRTVIRIQKTKVEPTNHLTVPESVLPQTPKPAVPPPAPIQPSFNARLCEHIAQMSKLVKYVMNESPHILPADPREPITSSHINDFTHAMWQVAFKSGSILQRACQYGALFSPLKLAALARLNYLPSWWYFRSIAVGEFKGPEMALWVDDREEEKTFQEAVQWCISVLGKRVEKGGGGGGDGEKSDEGIKSEAEDATMEEHRAFWL